MTTRRRPSPPDFWTLVFRQFRKRKRAVVALGGVLALFACAIFAPFIASQRPLYIEEDSGAAFPVIAALGAADLTWLGGLLAALAGAIANALLKRRDPQRTHRGRSLGVFGAVFVACTALAAFRLDRADPVDWAARAQAAESAGATVLRAPIPFGPNQGNLLQRLVSPGDRGHYLGTDSSGRDVAARMVWGARISLVVGFVAVGIYVTIGMIVGSVAGYFGGGVDMVSQRLIEVMMCFPVFFLILAVLAFVRPSIFNIMIVLGLTGWTGVARLVRAEMLRLRGLDFVTAGVAMGASSRRLIFRHLIPNAMSPVLVAATFGVAGAILTEAGLSFLGFGVPPPTASWGQLLQDGRSYALSHPWLSLYPGLAIFLTVTAYNLVGEGLRDAMDPRLTK